MKMLLGCFSAKAVTDYTIKLTIGGRVYVKIVVRVVNFATQKV